MIREMDIFARIGGDEFILLLPETDFETSKGLLRRIIDGLLNQMKRSNWPITFSIGAVTFLKAPHNVRELVSHADEMMYKVKRHGKNRILQAEWNGE
jgi:diguanylate cyclase (GGDEF)-like protein